MIIKDNILIEGDMSEEMVEELLEQVENRVDDFDTWKYIWKG